MDASGRSASDTIAFSATYPESLQGDHLMWLYEGVPQANAAAAGKFVCTEACNCRKLGDNCRNTHDDQE